MAKKSNLSYQDIEKSLRLFNDEKVNASEVGYAVLKAFGKSDTDIRRYKEGKGILASFDGLLIKNYFCYKSAETTCMTTVLEELKNDVSVLKASPMIIAVSDGETIIAYDTREKETFENQLKRIYCDFTFFYPLAGVEKFHSTEESPADIKAAEKLAKLHDEIRAYNDFTSESDLRDLNTFIARLLFCFFAEDTGIFADSLFTDSIVRYTKEDGSDLSTYLDEAFAIMNVKERNEDTNAIIKQFPYVAGSLFNREVLSPKLGRRARKIIIESGELDWKSINPDIFGSMIQAVVNPDVRAQQGMHYTSVPNIMKVIGPLFLDELRGEYLKLKAKADEQEQLWKMGAIDGPSFAKAVQPVKDDCDKLLLRISKMKFFDPACGSGNFLIITYKMLRALEIDILRVRQQCAQGNMNMPSVIKISQFYGIELLDFPHEVAMLSLWLAEHQMNKQFEEIFGVNTRALPLKDIQNIHCGNSCRLDWNVVCPHTKEEEVYIFGNPPYLGSKLQSTEQKKDIELVFNERKNSKILDYISIWFEKASLYSETNRTKYAYVTTNSISQGEQVAVLWPAILDRKQEILFAHTSFKWANNAKNNAGVTVAIIGLGSNSNTDKYLFTGDQKIVCSKINPYLIPDASIIVQERNNSISGFPEICFGCMPYDGGNLLMEEYDYQKFVIQYPDDVDYVKQIYGARELISGTPRYCLWIEDKDVKIALSNPEIARRVQATKEVRLASKDGQKLAEKPHQFREHPELSDCIIIPRHSSENREYIPIGYLEKGSVVADSALFIGSSDMSLFGILTSKIHMIWVKTIGGRLETRYRYSAKVCYNTFPFPHVKESKRNEISIAAEDVLMTRAGHPEMTIAELYDPETMPKDLREAHNRLDDIVDSCYPGYPFASDEARLECLFKMYEKMTKKK